MTTSFPIWAILGHLQKKYILIISQTQEQARQHFKNLKMELESNELLKRDLGPFQEQDEWSSCSLIIPRYNAKIIAVSREQSFRGIKYGPTRPDLIIADDCEDMASVKTKEGRKNTREWFTGEVLPLGDNGTKIIVVGNLLHQNSLLMTLIDDIKSGKRSGVYRIFPLLNDKNEIAWPGKYPDLQAVEKEKQKIGDKFAWAREFLLQIIDDTEPVVDKSWINYYDQLPDEVRGEHTEYVIGVDLAAGESETGDYTAIVSAKVYGYGKNKRIYILPNPINKRMSINDTVNKIEQLALSYGGRFSTKIFVEDVMLQCFLTQLLVQKNLRAEGLKIGRMDKRERLHFSSSLIQSKQIFFPKSGCKELIEQITEFGTTTHDDLVDAFSVMIMHIINHLEDEEGSSVEFVPFDIGYADIERRISGRSRYIGRGITISDSINRNTSENRFPIHDQGSWQIIKE